MALKLLMYIKFGFDVQTHRQHSPSDGVITRGFGPTCKWKVFENDEDWNVFLPLLSFDGVWFALSPPPPQSPCHTCSQLLPALKLQTFLVHLAFYIERWKYFSNLWENYYVPCWENCVYGSCRETSSSVPVHNSFAVSSSSFSILEQYRKNLLPPFGWAWVSPIFEIKSICSAVCVFHCCPQNNHWVLAEHSHSYYVPQIFGFGCTAALHLRKLNCILLLVGFQSQYSAAEGIKGVIENQTCQYWCLVPDVEGGRKQGLLSFSAFALSS